MTERTEFSPDEQRRVDIIHNILGQMRQLDSNASLPVGVSCRQLVDDVMERWAPEAERLGLASTQKELLELAVKVGYPDDYRRLKNLLQESEAMCENVFKTFALPIRAMLDDLGIEYTFLYRMKSVYSIWRKMRIDKKHFDDVYDLFATRIVYKVPDSAPSPLAAPNLLDDIPGMDRVRRATAEDMNLEQFYCWRIYNVLSMLYRIHPDRIKNWITHPKPSGYQALQLTVMGPDCNWIEIQIRSERMDYEAEHGAAAHWKYKAETAVK